MSSNSEDLKLFIRWFVIPYRHLKTVSDGDAAFAALSIGFLLCERYYRIVTVSQEEPEGDKFRNKAAEELDVNKEFFSIFWSTYRNGLMHQGTPQIYERAGYKYKWLIDGDFHEYPTYYDENGFRYICLNPWKFTDFMISKFLDNPHNLNGSIIYNLGRIFDAGLSSPPVRVTLSQRYPN